MKQLLKRITTWQQLFDLCDFHQCALCDEIIPQKSLDSQVSCDITQELAKGISWKSIRLKLIYIEEGQYYLRHHALQYIVLDEEDFAHYKSQVQEWLTAQLYAGTPV